MAPPTDEHSCAWQQYANELEQKLEAVQQRLAQLEKHVIGPQSEKQKKGKRTGKMPPAVAAEPASPNETRSANRALRDEIETEVTPVPVPPSACKCPHCGAADLGKVGDGKPSIVYEFVAAHFRKRIYLRETRACACGQYVTTAPAPDRVGDKTRYAPSFIAHLIVSKCADNRAHYNLAKEYARIGIPIGRSTITSLFHRAADVLEPLTDRLFERIAAEDLVLADETSMRMQRVQKRAFIWAFLGGPFIGYRFSCSRSGATPSEVLGDSVGKLVCDAYTGYNKLLSSGCRRRAGCLAHARRKVFEAQPEPAAAEALELIGKIYAVEHEAKKCGIQGSAAHAELRRTRSRTPFAELLIWARRQRREHAPKTLLGRAARYILNNFRELGVFLRDARVPPDNNASEAALRRVALGRKVFLFVGHEEAGHRLARLYSLVASCELNRRNPIAYLTDVLTRVDHHPTAKIDELLPDVWQPP